MERVASEILKHVRGIQEHNPNTGSVIYDCIIAFDVYINKINKRIQETITDTIQLIRIPDLTKEYQPYDCK